MSFLRNHQRKLMGLGVVGGAFYFFNPLRTPAVGNIEKRFSSGGGTPDHTPAIASARGQPDQAMGKHEGQHGLNTAHYEEKIEEQRPQKTLMQKTMDKQRYPNKGDGSGKGLK